MKEIEENAHKFERWERDKLKLKLDRIGVETSITKDPYSIHVDKYHNESGESMSTASIIVTITIVVVIFTILGCLAYLYLKDETPAYSSDGPHNNWNDHPARSIEEQNARTEAENIYYREQREEAIRVARARGFSL